MRRRLALALWIPWLLAGCSALGPPLPRSAPLLRSHAPAAALRAGAAVVDITPQGPVFMGGYGFWRRSRGVHDPLRARAVVLEVGSLRLGLVALDVVGLQRGDRRALDDRLAALGFEPRNVLVHATHNHSGPDSIGLWGLPPFYSGRSQATRDRLEAGVLEALARAQADLRPAELAAASRRVEPAGLLRNLRRPGLVDRELVVLHLREAGGGPSIATLLELGCHPEALPSSNRLISADFPGVAVGRVERELGGVGIYLSGALGGLVSPDLREGPEIEPFAEVERIGQRLAREALAAVSGLAATDYTPRPALTALHAPVHLRQRNWRYSLLETTRILRRKVYRGGYLESEVNLWRVGPLHIATVPGEITPDLGLRIKQRLAPSPTLLLGLANDELGYLLPEADYGLPLFAYERTVSPGPDAASRVMDRLEDLRLLLDAADAAAP